MKKILPLIKTIIMPEEKEDFNPHKKGQKILLEIELTEDQNFLVSELSKSMYFDSEFKGFKVTAIYATGSDPVEAIKNNFRNQLMKAIEQLT
jgi:hypothetical protein